ncbi:MAG: hypothetical protein QMD10_12680, partial [Desulfitobacteriaceae bacterium]|nr:hypothetical protein [Desulfitobacteriaceae bacterium]
MITLKETTYDRQTLYEEVWKEPVLIVAKRYGVSDVALHKICKRLKVPVPGRGYWSRLRAEEKVKREPLPAYEGPQRIIVRRNEEPVQNPQGERSELLSFLDDATRATVFEVIANLAVPEELTKPHPLVAEAQKRLRSQKPGNNSPLLSPGRDGLDILVTRDTLDRSLRIMDTLIKGLETLGYPALISDGHTVVHIRGEKLPIRLVERTRQVDHVLTPEELEKKRKYQYWLAPRYDHLPTGKLTLTIGSFWGQKRNWNDGKKQRIEACLGKVIIALLQAAEDER